MPAEWTWPVLSQVTDRELVIYATSPPTRKGSPLSLSVLSNMPQLRVLDLSQSLPKFPFNYDGMVDENDLVSLPFLRQLRLDCVGTFRDCAFLLNNLPFPPHTGADCDPERTWRRTQYPVRVSPIWGPIKSGLNTHSFPDPLRAWAKQNTLLFVTGILTCHCRISNI